MQLSLHSIFRLLFKLNRIALNAIKAGSNLYWEFNFQSMSYEVGSVVDGGGGSILDRQLLMVQNDLSSLSLECRDSVETSRQELARYRFSLFFIIFGGGLIGAGGNVGNLIL